jgi:hypothetical protein
MTVYVGGQYRILDIEFIEIIGHLRTLADGDGPIIWLSQG